MVPIHQINSDTDTNMDDDKTPKERAETSGKRSIDLADDLHKAVDEARRVLPDLPMSGAMKRAVEEAQDAAGRTRCWRGLDDSQIDDDADEEMLEETERGDRRQRDEETPGGSGRSHLQCEIRKKHARKGAEPCRVYA